MFQQPFSSDAGPLPAASVSSFVPRPPADPPEPGAELLDESAALPIDPAPFGASPARLAGRGPRPGKRLISPQEVAASNRKLSAEQKLLILDTWQRSGLSANDFATLIGVNRITLYA